MIIDHTHYRYRQRRELLPEAQRHNGAYYYSREIVKNIIPLVETDRNWITINIQGVGVDHSIVFIHNNLHPENYDWLKYYGYKDLVLVCGIKETCEKVAHLGTAIYLPLSIDVDYVKQFMAEERTKKAAFAGRRSKANAEKLPADIDYLCGMKRPQLLAAMAEYKQIYAVGRTAIEAKALGCTIKAYDERFPDTRRWKVVDNKDAAKMLQKQLDRIDKR